MKSFFRTLLILFVGGTCLRLARSAPSTGALVAVKVDVPASNWTMPFNRGRVLRVPEGAKISVLARVEKARFLAVRPQGDVLVAQPSRGKILLVRKSGPAEAKVSELIGGLRLPQGMVFQSI